MGENIDLKYGKIGIIRMAMNRIIVGVYGQASFITKAIVGFAIREITTMVE